MITCHLTEKLLSLENISLAVNLCSNTANNKKKFLQQISTNIFSDLKKKMSDSQTSQI
jgi:hypothetical protein